MQHQLRQVLASLPITDLLKVWSKTHLENSPWEKQFEPRAHIPLASLPFTTPIKASGNKRRQPCPENRQQQAERQRGASLKFYTGNRSRKRRRKEAESRAGVHSDELAFSLRAQLSSANTSQVLGPCYFCLHLHPASFVCILW